MRYALYCGEPIFIGFFRTPPGPRFWLLCYMTLFLAHIWPFMASNAAVPLASAMIGHLPGNGVVRVAGFVVSEVMLVKVLGYVVFFVAFLPLIFGGKIASMLERLMLVKLVVVFGFLLFVGRVHGFRGQLLRNRLRLLPCRVGGRSCRHGHCRPSFFAARARRLIRVHRAGDTRGGPARRHGVHHSPRRVVQTV